MYDNDDTPSADSAQRWLGLLVWLEEKRLLMGDRFLRDFSAAWFGEGDARPPQRLHNETVALARKEQKDDSSGSLDGTIAYQFSDDGKLTLIGAGRQHIELSHAAQDQLQALLNSRPIPPDVLQGPPASVYPLPGAMSAPMTNRQYSARQNELAAQWLKQRR